MAKAKISRPPSEYPPVAFHLIRLAQFLSSMIVSSILAYFIHFLLIETYAIPWTFILVRIQVIRGLEDNCTDAVGKAFYSLSVDYRHLSDHDNFLSPKDAKAKTQCGYQWFFDSPLDARFWATGVESEPNPYT